MGAMWVMSVADVGMVDPTFKRRWDPGGRCWARGSGGRGIFPRVREQLQKAPVFDENGGWIERGSALWGAT